MIILEPRPRVSARALLDRMAELVVVLRTRSPAGALWILEPGRIRIRNHDDES